MYNSERGWNLSFAGCGFLVLYHLGVTRCLLERAPHLILDARRLYGSSSGALHIAGLLGGLPLDRLTQAFMEFSLYTRNHKLGVFQPSYNLIPYLRHVLYRHLPDNIHQLVSDRLVISLTRVSDGENVLLSDFKSKEEVVQALLCSCFIPIIFGFIPLSFRGERYIDGALSDNVPSSQSPNTISVSPFCGENDICPKIMSTNFFHVDFNRVSLHLCRLNVDLLVRIIFPYNAKELRELSLRGYLDAFRFLEEKGICDKPSQGLSLALKKMDTEAGCWDNPSLKPPGKVVAMEMKPERYELLDHFRLNFTSWDEGILEILSPSLIMVLNESIRLTDSYKSRICNFLPIKIMSYLMLPCTLPIEAVIFWSQRLVLWLPSVPSDLKWLQQMFFRACSLVRERLLSPTRSQTPASTQQVIPRKPRPSEPCWPSLSSKDLDAHQPGDCPVTVKAETAWHRVLQSSLASMSGNNTPSEGGMATSFPAFPAEKSL